MVNLYLDNGAINTHDVTFMLKYVPPLLRSDNN